MKYFQVFCVHIWFWVVWVKKKKKQECQVGFQGKLIFFQKYDFNHFYESHWYIKNGIHRMNLVNILDMKWFLFRLKSKCKKSYVKIRVCKINTKKTFFVVLFSNACSILELFLCNQNLTKLVYPTLLSSNCRAWAWAWASIWKSTIFPSKLGQKGH